MKIAGSLYRMLPLPKGYVQPCEPGTVVLVLGQIDQMPGHVVFVAPDGKTHFGYHLDNFKKLKASEL